MRRRRRRGFMVILLTAVVFGCGAGAAEPGALPGGSPSQWGDFAPETLPHVGLKALEPAVRVEASSADWLAGRDPALAAALR